MRNRSTLEFLSTWEEIYNPNFKVFESEHFKRDVGLVKEYDLLIEIEGLKKSQKERLLGYIEALKQ